MSALIAAKAYLCSRSAFDNKAILCFYVLMCYSKWCLSSNQKVWEHREHLISNVDDRVKQEYL